MLTAVTFAICLIAVLAIAASMYLLDQRSKLQDRIDRLERVVKSYKPTCAVIENYAFDSPFGREALAELCPTAA